MGGGGRRTIWVEGAEGGLWSPVLDFKASGSGAALPGRWEISHRIRSTQCYHDE